MGRRGVIIQCICLLQTGVLYAQWTAKDSTRAGDEPPGKPAKMDIPSPKEQRKTAASSSLSIVEDFSEYLKNEPEKGKVDPLSLPPAVFMRYGLDAPLLEPSYSTKVFGFPQSTENAVKPSGISFDDGLQMLFKPSFRAKMRNRQNANAWKTY
jgi:hypothetical protein